MVTTSRFPGLESHHQAAAQFQAGVAGEKGLLHGCQHALINQAIAGNRQITLMAMPCPRAAILPRPTGRTTIQIDQVKLTPVTVLIIRKKAGQNALSIRTLLQALKATNPQIRIGVGLGGNGTNPGADVRHGGSNSQMTGGNRHAEATVAGITGQDRKSHGS
jgi:hypothetical protein